MKGLVNMGRWLLRFFQVPASIVFQVAGFYLYTDGIKALSQGGSVSEKDRGIILFMVGMAVITVAMLLLEDAFAGTEDKRDA